MKATSPGNYGDTEAGYQQGQESLGLRGHTGSGPFPFEVQHHQNLSRGKEISLTKQCCSLETEGHLALCNHVDEPEDDAK